MKKALIQGFCEMSEVEMNTTDGGLLWIAGGAALAVLADEACRAITGKSLIEWVSGGPVMPIDCLK